MPGGQDRSKPVRGAGQGAVSEGKTLIKVFMLLILYKKDILGNNGTRTELRDRAGGACARRRQPGGARQGFRSQGEGAS